MVSSMVEIPHQYIQHGVAIALGVLAYIFWREEGEGLETQHGHLHGNTHTIEHEHMHWHKDTGYHSHIHVHLARTIPGLRVIAGTALVLGFVHEEEFVILALAVGGGVDPLLLLTVYATAVAIALMEVTVLAVKTYTYVQHRIIRYSRYLPKVTASVLAAMAVGFAVGVL
ncbi:MAG: hypothetical protein RMI32_07825 [Candidatus Nitrosocaldus sp.]|nr:hypothetical protein [Candidatus Nitrosocaldus sp.]